jgi:hypothetical protein
MIAIPRGGRARVVYVVVALVGVAVYPYLSARLQEARPLC